MGDHPTPQAVKKRLKEQGETADATGPEKVGTNFAECWNTIAYFFLQIQLQQFMLQTAGDFSKILRRVFFWPFEDVEMETKRSCAASWQRNWVRLPWEGSIGHTSL